MKIALIGRTEILLETAEKLISRGHKIPIIITCKEAAEYKKTTKDFEYFSKKINAKYICTQKINTNDIVQSIKKSNADIGISMNFCGIIDTKIIDIFKHGILNAHAGDLPKYRGNAVLAWALINGEKRIGLCIHKMVGNELDSGDIIIRKYYNNVTLNTKIRQLYTWIEKEIPMMFCEAIELLENDENYILEKQSKNSKDILRCYPRLPEDAKIDWNKSNIEILRLINASSYPFDGAYSEYDGKIIKILDAEIYNDNEIYSAVPGQIAIINNNEVVVITGKGKLVIKEIKINDIVIRPTSIIKSIRTRLK